MIAGHDSLFDLLRRQRLAAATVLAIAVLAAINWIQEPELAGRWLRIMLILPAACGVVTLWLALLSRMRPRAMADDAHQGRRYFEAALALLVVAVGIRQIALLCLEIWIRIGDHGVDLEFERRILGLTSAAVFVALGNAIPKILTPLSILPLHLAERQSRARRFIGPILVLLGIAMTIAFIALPVPLALSLERWSFVTGMLAVLAAVVWMNLRPAQGTP